MKERFVTRLVMRIEFLDVILGIPNVDLVQEMVPVVLPKLIVLQQNNFHALATLHELET